MSVDTEIDATLHIDDMSELETLENVLEFAWKGTQLLALDSPFNKHVYMLRRKVREIRGEVGE